LVSLAGCTNRLATDNHLELRAPPGRLGQPMVCVPWLPAAAKRAATKGPRLQSLLQLLGRAAG
jgi:hypothetical protein